MGECSIEARFVCIFLLSHLYIGEMYKLGRAGPWNWQCLSNSIWGKFNLVTSFPLNLTVPKCLSPVFSGNQGNTVNGTHLSREWLTRNSTSVRISLFSSFLMVRLKVYFWFSPCGGLKDCFSILSILPKYSFLSFLIFWHFGKFKQLFTIHPNRRKQRYK